MFNPSSPVTGQAITGLTSPTYTLAADTPISIYERQWTVSALGGTQAGVVAHTADRPFTIRSKRPSSIKQLAVASMQGSLPVYKSVPVNPYEVLVNTKAPIDASGNVGPLRVRIVLEAAAGIPTNGQAQLSAALSLAIGAVVQQINGLRDNVINGQN